METTCQSRRRFFGSLIAGFFSLLMLGKFLTPKVAVTGKTVTLAKADLPPDAAIIYREHRLAVIREGEEFYALDLACTHLGCTVVATPAGLSCPCHGSRFDRRGNVLSGPAGKPLHRYSVEVHGEQLVVRI
jgi:Rieske Fe-S protein